MSLELSVIMMIVLGGLPGTSLSVIIADRIMAIADGTLHGQTPQLSVAIASVISLMPPRNLEILARRSCIRSLFGIIYQDHGR